MGLDILSQAGDYTLSCKDEGENLAREPRIQLNGHPEASVVGEIPSFWSLFRYCICYSCSTGQLSL